MKGSDVLTHASKVDRRTVPLFDFHIHTSWTDGADSVESMHRAAERAGLQYILYSEHARASSGEWFMEFAEQVRALPTGRCAAFVGVETKVADFEGNLDINKAILSECDLVMASVHRFPGEKGVVKGFGEVDPDDAIQTELSLSLAVLENPDCHILGHPFGMSIRRFDRFPTEDHFRELIGKAVACGKAFEINSHYHPDPWRLVELCQEEDALVSLGSNAHDVNSVGLITRVLRGEESVWKK